jgi:murein L,D-transpeptidase YcbB/YkuD
MGDLPSLVPAPDDSSRYEGKLVEGVRRFQDRHGLEPDGVIGKGTVAALNVPFARRVRQIELGLERLRWMPDLTGGRFIVVNIPTFQLWAWDSLPADGAPTLSMNVVVGTSLKTMTPVMQEEMAYLVFRPYWNVPRSITTGEILPKLARDPGYLVLHNMELVAGGGDDARPLAATPANIERLAKGQLRVRQRPGPKNSLGLVKFIFPNDQAIYLHDTPATALFSRARRDFSHGCVRVERPVDLAAWVLSERPEWTRDRIVEAMQRGKSQRVSLPRQIPVFLFYTTALSSPDGTVRFAEDIYGQDARLLKALEAR